MNNIEAHMSLKNSGLQLLYVLGFIFLLPHFTFVSFKLSSLAVGLVFVAMVFAVLYVHLFSAERLCYESLVTALLFMSIIILYAVYGYVSTNSFKPILSLIFLFMLLLSIQIKQLFTRTSFVQLFNVFNFSGFSLFLLGWTSFLVNVEIGNYSFYEKPVFPFSEESHFALAVGMVSVGVISVASIRLSLFYLLNLFGLSLLFPNLTLLVFTFMAVSVLLLRVRPLFLVPALIFGAICLVIALNYLISSVEYFSSRIDLLGSTNLTTLVWVQGWELAFLNFIESNGFGLGFQSLGLSTTILPEISNQIFKISGEINNLEDGGFLASKLIAEFGLIGLVASFYFLTWLFRYFFITNSLHAALRFGVSASCSDIIKKRILLSSLLFAFLVEFFLRGYGYFSPGLVVVVAVIMYLINKENKRSLYECSNI